MYNITHTQASFTRVLTKQELSVPFIRLSPVGVVLKNYLHKRLSNFRLDASSLSDKAPESKDLPLEPTP
jgi:hypothetical protein